MDPRIGSVSSHSEGARAQPAGGAATTTALVVAPFRGTSRGRRNSASAASGCAYRALTCLALTAMAAIALAVAAAAAALPGESAARSGARHDSPF